MSTAIGVSIDAVFPTQLDNLNTTISMNKIVYVDMDNVLVDFKSGIARLEPGIQAEFDGRLDEVPGIFSLMDPMPGAMEALEKLHRHYELYILSTAPWLNPSAWIDKVSWIQKHFGKHESSLFYKRLIISHHKNLNKGHYLIDDRPNNGAEHFEGEWIHFGKQPYSDWEAVTTYLLNKS